MHFLSFAFFVLVILAVLFVVGAIPQKIWTDYDSPLNLFVYQEPKATYTDQLVNLWVNKGWRSDGERIPCRLEQSATLTTPNSERLLVLYSHGNAENLLTCAQFVRELSERLETDVVAWDYSGYGLNKSDRFERSPEGVNLTLKTVYDHVTGELGYAPDRVILWGFSLGSGPSVALAAQLSQSQRPPAALVLFGAYASILDLVKEHTSPEVASLFTERWDSKRNIKAVACPILLLHGQNDGLIPARHAEILRAANPKAKKILFPNCGHTKFGFADCVMHVRKFLTEQNIIYK